MKDWFIRHFGVVRLRQLIENVTHRLSFVPIAMVAAAVLLSQLTLWIDRQLGSVDLPAPLETSVDSSRPVFSTIAGGLITAVTLLLSMLLVAIQLASANFSPRTLRNWLGDARLRRSIGIVLSTAVFCLMGLRSVRTEADAVRNPTVTVLIAMLLGVVSLIVMIRAVDHVTSNMQVGSVARRLVDETLRALDASRELAPNQRPHRSTSLRGTAVGHDDRPDDVRPIESPGDGWIQQIDVGTLAAALPEGATVWIDVSHGDHVVTSQPLAHVDGNVELGDDLYDELTQAFAIGETRTMQQDVGFGLGQLSDIAVRALSPGVNDPATAIGIIVSVTEVLCEVWSQPDAEPTLDCDGRTVHRPVPDHRVMLLAAYDAIRHHGRHDPAVLTALARSIQVLRAETVRRELPGPVEPLDDFLADIGASADDDAWLPRDRDALERVVAASFDDDAEDHPDAPRT